MMENKMELRAQITVDISASDFVEAADHQSRLTRFVEELKVHYPEVQLVIRERRDRKPDPSGLPNAQVLKRPAIGARQAKSG
jgi:hypothetical protein